MSDDFEDFEMEIVEEDELDELGADGAASSEKSFRSEGRKEEEETAGEEGSGEKIRKIGNPKFSNSGENGGLEKMDSNEIPKKHWTDPEATQLERDAFGALPSDWEYVQTSGSLEYIRSGISESQNQDGEGIPVTRIETISDGSVDYEKVGYVKVDSEEADADQLKSGDLLFSNINSREQIGKTAVYRGEKPLYHGMNLLRLRYQEEVLHPLFAYYLYDSPMAKDIFFRLAQAAVGQSSINQGQLKNLSLPRPPLPEQRKIASVLYAVDQAIQKTEEVIEQHRTFRQALINHLLSEGLSTHSEILDRDDLKILEGGISTDMDRTSVGRSPSSWERVRLSEVTTESSYGVAESAQDFDPHLLRYVRITDISADGRLKDEDPASLPADAFDQKCLLSAGDLLFARSGATVGKTLLYRDHHPKSVYAGYLIRFVPNTRKVLPEYLFYYTQTRSYQNWVTRVTRKGAQENINAQEYGSILLSRGRD